jgi:hypothetical protein
MDVIFLSQFSDELPAGKLGFIFRQAQEIFPFHHSLRTDIVVQKLRIQIFRKISVLNSKKMDVIFLSRYSDELPAEKLGFIFRQAKEIFSFLHGLRTDTGVQKLRIQWVLWALSPGVKAIPVTGRGGSYGYEMSRITHFLDNLLTDGGEIVSLRSRPLFTTSRFLVLFSVSG